MLTGLTTVRRYFAARAFRQRSCLGAAVGALVIVTDLDFLLVFKLLNLIDRFNGGIIGFSKWFLAGCLVAFFPIIGLAYLAAVESLLAAGAGEEGDVGDTAVGAARGHGGHAGESSLTMAWLQYWCILVGHRYRYRYNCSSGDVKH